MKIGLYFGSFNPIHNGHLIIANYIIEYSDMEQLWFVVSPQNPFKTKGSLLSDYHRYEMVSRAIEDYPNFRVSNIEFNLPKPSYTVDTLAYLYDKYPQHKFSLIIGSDNLPTFYKWKNYEVILANYHIYVYPRPGYDIAEFEKYANIHIINAPLMEISSSFIRTAISEGKEVPFFMQKDAYNYMRQMNFYTKKIPKTTF